MEIKQLFCRHVYKTVKKEFLNQKTLKYIGYCVYYKHFAYHEVCVKCGKEKISKGIELE